MNLKNKVAVVTGAASGLGLATCQVLAEGGAKIVALDRDEAGLATIDLSGADVLTCAVDVANEASAAAAIDAAKAKFGAVHILVNCAGVADAAKTVSRGVPFPAATWDKVIRINLTGTFNMIKFASLVMSGNEPDEETGERGVIVNTSSGAAHSGQMGQAAYSASKAGVAGMTLPIARDLASLGIRVVAILPGLFETAMVAGMPDNVVRAMTEKMILFPNRMGRGREFAALARHIVENGYLNATTIDLDAGARMSNR
jgi:NAD(P)-dependent dehydrogenase (short-subunit alcohol dehydrogenase family)